MVKHYKNDAVFFSVHHKMRSMLLMYLIASIVSLDHLGKVLPAKFLHCEVKISSLFFFYFNKHLTVKYYETM